MAQRGTIADQGALGSGLDGQATPYHSIGRVQEECDAHRGAATGRIKGDPKGQAFDVVPPMFWLQGIEGGRVAGARE